MKCSEYGCSHWFGQEQWDFLICKVFKQKTKNFFCWKKFQFFFVLVRATILSGNLQNNIHRSNLKKKNLNFAQICVMAWKILTPWHFLGGNVNTFEFSFFLLIHTNTLSTYCKHKQTNKKNKKKYIIQCTWLTLVMGEVATIIKRDRTVIWGMRTRMGFIKSRPFQEYFWTCLLWALYSLTINKGGRWGGGGTNCEINWNILI